ncbi:hypothetical protein Pmani_021447 [Petrolisthes manimaculis]|uniref:Apoptosis regulatory protein Siva n=1 Tax=Petrolisthes manimaculis TaxID=1843537 RepID=A0AAE1TWT6_9EUCA|nr:hypothetical protein Pmani_027107 [Petrolisthes manimaculis]KAK4306746.1 hypothetical protein Pmani_021447 [Petrolisthes manimaculis]
MPKRTFPFDDSFIPQAKIHIGNKEVENGVMRKDKMKAVYDRTLNLLFLGAKNVQNNNAMEKMDTGSGSQTTPPHHHHLTTDTSKLHQMLLTSRGTLAKPTVTPVRPTPMVQSACVGCHRVLSSPRPSCSYCECKLCDTCLRICNFCGGTFCPKCSLLVYLQEEKVVCLSCC